MVAGPLALLVVIAAAQVGAPKVSGKDGLPKGAVQRLGRAALFQLGPIQHAAFSADGTRIATSGDLSLRLWNDATGTETLRIPLPREARRFALAPDGSFACVADATGAILVFDLRSGKALKPVRGPGREITALVLSIDGSRLVSATDDAAIQVWDLATRTLSGEEQADGKVDEILTVPGSEFVLTRTVKGTQTWRRGDDLAPVELDLKVQGRAAAFSGDGSKVACVKALDGGRGLEISLKERKNGAELKAFTVTGRPITCFAFSADLDVAAVGEPEGIVTLYKVNSGQKLTTSQDRTRGSINAVVFSPDGTQLAVRGSSPRLALLQVPSGVPLFTWEGHLASVNALSWSRDGKLMASGGNDKRARLWSLEKGSESGSFETIRETDAVGISPDGKTLVAADRNGAVQWWSISTHERLGSLPGGMLGTYAAAISSDGLRVARGGGDNSILIRDLATLKDVLQFPVGDGAGIPRIAWSPDGKTIAAAQDLKVMKFFEAGTGKEIAALKGQSNAVRAITFSPDGTLAASGSDDRSVMVWEWSAGRQRFFRDLGSRVLAVAFSADGAMIAAATDRGRICILATADGTELGVLNAGESIGALVMAPGGGRLASGAESGCILLWDLAPFRKSPPPK